MFRTILPVFLSVFLAGAASAQETTDPGDDTSTAYYVLHDIEASDTWSVCLSGRACYGAKEDLKARIINFYTAALQYGQTDDFEGMGFITPDLDYTNGTLQELAKEWQCTDDPSAPAWLIQQHYSQNSRRFFSIHDGSEGPTSALFWLEFAEFQEGQEPDSQGMWHSMLKLDLWFYHHHEGKAWRDQFSNDANGFWEALDIWRDKPLQNEITDYSSEDLYAYRGKMYQTSTQFYFFITTFQDPSRCVEDAETGEVTFVFWNGDYWSDTGGNVYTDLPAYDDTRHPWGQDYDHPPGTDGDTVPPDPRDQRSPYNPHGDLDGDGTDNMDEDSAEYCGPTGDHDGDGIPNADDTQWSADICSRDSDGDGIADRVDPEPLLPFEPGDDWDGDGIPDNEDPQPGVPDPNGPGTGGGDGDGDIPPGVEDPANPGKDDICVPGETEGECLNGSEGSAPEYQEAPSRFFTIMTQFVDISELRGAKVCPEIVFPDPGIPFFETGEIPLPIDCAWLDILGVFVLISAAWFGFLLVFT